MNSNAIVDDLYLCAATCDACYKDCLLENKNGELDRCIMLLRDCYDICNATATIYGRNSENTDLLMELCGEICEKCASECEKHVHMDHCRKSAEACSHCADMCKSFRIS